MIDAVTRYLADAYPEYPLKGFPQTTPRVHTHNDVAFAAFTDHCPLHGYAHSSNHWWAMIDIEAVQVMRIGCHHDTDAAPRKPKHIKGIVRTAPYSNGYFDCDTTEHPCWYDGTKPGMRIRLDGSEQIMEVLGPHRACMVADEDPQGTQCEARAWSVKQTNKCPLIPLATERLLVCTATVFIDQNET